MKSGTGSFLQAYNAQAVVNGKTQVITACALSQQAADVVHLPAMLDEVMANTGVYPKTLLADPGYFSEENMNAAAERSVNVLIPPDRQRHGSLSAPAAELSVEELSALPPIEQMRHRVSTEVGRDSYRKRKGIVEPVFGQIKGGAGNPGFLGFLRRGLEKCSAEWQWTCAAHNIHKYIRHKKTNKSDDNCKQPAKRKVKQPRDVSIGSNQLAFCL
jgi:hypothetical protein